MNKFSVPNIEFCAQCTRVKHLVPVISLRRDGLRIHGPLEVVEMRFCSLFSSLRIGTLFYCGSLKPRFLGMSVEMKIFRLCLIYLSGFRSCTLL